MSESGATCFVQALMQHLATQSRVPKVQAERAIGPIIGMFIPEVLSVYFDKTITMLCAEFPLLKDGKKFLSTNIDWLLYNVEDEQFEFVELKTTPVFSPKQFKRYLEVIR